MSAPDRPAPATTPSEYPVPSASSENALARPSRAIAPSRDIRAKLAESVITVAPPTRASEHSPPRSPRAAVGRATGEGEEAVPPVTAGPPTQRVWKGRRETTPAAGPVGGWAATSS